MPREEWGIRWLRLPRANRTSLTFRLTLILWSVSAAACLLVMSVSTAILLSNIREDTKKDLEQTTERLVSIGLQDLNVFDEHEKLPSILRGVLSITRLYRIIRIFDEFGILMYSNFPHDEIRFLDEGLSLDDDHSRFIETSRNYVTFRASYRLATGERRIVQMSQPLPRVMEVLMESIVPYLMVLFVLLLGMLVVSNVIAGRIFRPIRFVAEEMRQLKDRELKLWRSLPETKDGDFLDEIVEAANNLISRVQRSSIANQSLARFIAHEVRTPLTMMLGEIETAGYSSKSCEDYEAMLKVFASDIKKIDQIINTILELAQRDRAGQSYRPKAVSLSEVFSDLSKDFRKNYRAEVAVHLSESLPMVTMDPDLFSLLIDNFIRNSVKHGGEKSKPEIYIYSKSSLLVGVDIVDRGPGVSDDVIQIMNDPHSAPVSGLGIGLNLCREICRLASIPIHFTNLKPGLRISLELPVARGG